MADEGDEKSLSIPELRKLEEGLQPLVEPLPMSDRTREQVGTANAAVWVADELVRLVLSFLFGIAVLVALALFLTPWLWLAVGAWIASGIATIVSVRRRRASGSVPAIAPRR